ncbi:MAG: hypothetical protein Q9187_004795 [Circinaria calcarea]
MSTLSTETAYATIESAYSFRATNQISNGLRTRITAALGYDPVEAAAAPEAANIGEGCGNPLLIANLSEGQSVLDLGSGGGFDCFLAANKVGLNGRVIGIDMTEKMVELARRNAANGGYSNVTFLNSRISQLPVDDASIDCVLSNCVLNLVPAAEKPRVFAEIHRVLKPGGYVAVSDFLAYKPLPQEMIDDPRLQAGCVSGAVETAVMRKYLQQAGFSDILLMDSKKDLGLYKDGGAAKSVTPCCAGGACEPEDQVTASGRKELDYDINEWIGSFLIYALKGKEDGTTATVETAAVPIENSKQSCCGCKPGAC